MFEILADQDDTVILCLHKWVEHDHPTISSPEIQPGNGLILYMRVDNLDEVWKNTKKAMKSKAAAPFMGSIDFNSVKMENSVY